MRAFRRMVINDPMVFITPLIVFAITFAVVYIIRRLVLKALSAWAERTGSRPGRILVDALRGPLYIWGLILAVHLAIQLSEIPPRYTRWTAQTLAALWVLSLTLMCMKLARNMVRHYGDQIPGALPVSTLTETLAQLVVIILGVLIILNQLGFSITPILTALGVGGLAVALALQDTLANLFAGFYITVARQVRLSDYIKLDGGQEGYVIDISWRSTSIRSLANNLIVVPNSKLGQAIVTNYSLPEKRMGVGIQVNVGLDADPAHVERVLQEIGQAAAGQLPGMLSDPAPSVAFDPGVGEFSLGFSLNYQVAEFANQFAVRNELRRRIFLRFREEGISIPFPTRTVYLREPGVRDPEPGVR
ncbi:MAG TPA: mechanosensitive ion channel family protein [Bryobacteraceae bacterium]|nr:mechanosensitive ion channel family protein [Bryobacteraceae bacterium]